jgi:hypothetical protein
MSTFIGKPCKKCGNTERYISGNKPCVNCTKRSSKSRWEEGKTTEWKQKKKDQVNAYNRRRYHSLTLEEKKKRNRSQQVALYGLTLDQYDDMILNQNGLCALCGCPETNPKKFNMCIDHDHNTGKVRALLCDRCNRGIGSFGDNIDLLEKAVLYLKLYSPQI